MQHRAGSVPCFDHRGINHIDHLTLHVWMLNLGSDGQKIVVAVPRLALRDVFNPSNINPPLPKHSFTGPEWSYAREKVERWCSIVLGSVEVGKKSFCLHIMMFGNLSSWNLPRSCWRPVGLVPSWFHLSGASDDVILWDDLKKYSFGWSVNRRSHFGAWRIKDGSRDVSVTKQAVFPSLKGCNLNLVCTRLVLVSLAIYSSKYQSDE